MTDLERDYYRDGLDDAGYQAAGFGNDYNPPAAIGDKRWDITLERAQECYQQGWDDGRETIRAEEAA